MQFADHFWDEDFNGTTGYDNIIRHMKDGRKLCEKFIDFLNKRAKLEEEYGKNLMKISTPESHITATGTLKISFESMKTESENVGMCHLEVSRKLTEMSNKISVYRDLQKKETSKIDEKMKKTQKDKKVSHENLFRAKKAYEARCRENDACRAAYENKATYTPKEENKLKKNILKSQSNVESADSAYITCCRHLEESRKKWIIEMEDACEVFQRMETERIKFLRNELWIYTNIGAQQALDIDDRYEECRKVLEKCCEMKDIALFIEKNKTSSQKPSEIKYENYYYPNTKNTLTSDNEETHPGTFQIVDEFDDGIDIQYNQDGNYLSVMELNNSPSSPTNDRPSSSIYNRMLSKDSQEVSQSNPSLHAYSCLYDTHQSLQKVSNNNLTSPTYRRALFDYMQRSSQELTLKTGDLVEVIGMEDKHWGIGQLNGLKGAFPLNFTESC